MKVLVTGGCGFIGSNFIHYLARKHPTYKIINIDKLTYAGNLGNLKGLNKKKDYWFIKADICDKPVMKKVFQKYRPEAVVNFAAESHVDRSISRPAIFLKTNVLGAATLLDLSIGFGVEKFLHISTDEVYGSILRGKFTENSMLHPSSPYSASKAAADALVLAYHTTYGLPALITRSSNNYGPYQFPEKFIPLIIHNALHAKKIPLYGDGKNVRDWLYVEDNCEAIDMVLHKGRIGEIYNVGGHNEYQNIAVIRGILKALRKPASLIAFVRDRAGHDRRYALSITKIKRDIGWTPRTPFATGLRKTIQWYTNNPGWLKNTQTGAYRSFYKKYYSKLGLSGS
ncbi:dTDP-glucose 4,6-dehydratase [candidate division WOR-3 bacterium]|nr:dTDP-glucose 4,6-dehydratase [candidate division WOR-3 bacterium]